MQVLEFNDRQDCESFPLQAEFRSIQVPFKMSCNVFSKESKLRSSHYVNSWPSWPLPQIFPSPLRHHPQSHTCHNTQLPSYTSAITILCVTVLVLRQKKEIQNTESLRLWQRRYSVVLGDVEIADRENEGSKSASRHGVNTPKDWISNTKKTL